ncbi:hypothetical protein [Nocardia sp. NPDC049149]|uniref:hypothetical protein n=1 Tax=Nocardia sp. NPDC049149 TaxID=3364315 RepID=UPI00371E7862
MMRGTKAVLLVVLLMFAGGGAMAAAGPEPDQPTSNPDVAATPLFTLTTFPNAWHPKRDLGPQLQIFSDGRAVKTVDVRANGHLPREVLDAAIAETKSLATVDFGDPTVTDQGSQIIDYMPQSPDQEAHLVIYAPEFTTGLTDEQIAARTRFRNLYRTLLEAFVHD